MVIAKTGEKQSAQDKSTNPAVKVLNIETKWLVLLAIGVGTFMSALDGSIVNAILPVITDYFNTGVATIEWVVTVYLLVVSSLLLVVGRLGDLRGNKKTYIMGFFIFVLGSVSAGFSPSEAYLIGSRGLQAIGAAMLFANAPAILTKIFPASQRGQALGLQGTMTYLGLTTGPFLGGWVADHLSWHFVFFINVPIGLFAIWLSLKIIPNDTPENAGESFDMAGALTFMIGLTTLLFALNKGETLGWTSLPILAMMVAAFLILSLFIWIEGRVKTPMLDLSLFKRKIFAISTVSPILNYMCIYSILFLMPFYLIHGRGLSASHAGLILTAQPLVMALTAPFSGSLSDRVGSRLPTTLGMLILAAGLFLLGNSSSQTHLGIIVLGLATCGLGVGLFVSPNNSSLMGDAPRNRQGIASGILALARNVGMVLGIGLTGAIFTTFLSLGNPKDPGIMIHAFDMGLRSACGLALLAAVITSLRGNDRPKEKKTARKRIKSNPLYITSIKGTLRMKQIVIFIISAMVFIGCGTFHSQSSDNRKPESSSVFLQSWRDGTAKKQIVSFVEDVTIEGFTNFVPKEQRRAFFDMDGTLFCEKPNYIEVELAQQRLLEKVKGDPTLTDNPIYKAILGGDSDYLNKNVKAVIMEAFAGETLSFYIDYCRNFLKTQKHPRFNRSYASLFYLPMLELIKYLQDNGFIIYVVSTSQQEFIRSISEDQIGIQPQYIIGTMVGYTLANLKEDAPPIFVRNRSYFDPYNADDNKVVRMRERALLPAMFAFGNSMGDYAMLDATSDSQLPSLVCILDHDDAEREYEYHKETLLKKAQSHGWLVVSMKKDFYRVFADE